MSQSQRHHLGEEEPAAEALPPPPPPPPVLSKRTPWTEDEHSLFLKGLNKHGKGKWKIIARDFVTSRTPSQIARHAHGYFLRQNVVDKKRRSIHDTTIENDSLPRCDASSSSSSRTHHQENHYPKDALYVDMTIQKSNEGHLGIFMRDSDSDSDHLKILRIATLPAIPLHDTDFTPQKWIHLPYPFSTDLPPQNYRVFLEMLQHKPGDAGTNITESDLNELAPDT